MAEILNMEHLPELPYAVEEAMNRLRVNLSFLGKDVRKIMVISSLPNEGKSFVTTHLWRQMAMAGSKSVLVDADLRKSTMCEKYHLRKSNGEKLVGMTHYLSGDQELQDVIYETSIENGYLLPNSDNILNPSMLIEGKRFSETLDTLAEQYRYVFIDCPPLGLVSDGERIANLCDGAVLVVRGGLTSKKVIKNSVRQLERAGCPLLGVVMNRAGGSKKGYYGKQYGGYYGRYGGTYYYGQKGKKANPYYTDAK